MIFKTIKESEAEKFFQMLCQLDEETEYMMYESGERQARSINSDSLRSSIKASNDNDDLLLAAINDSGEIIGFIRAERGKLNRTRHAAYIVIGILRKYRGHGIGNTFFEQLDKWARNNDVVRLELTVECENTVAKKLYEKHGFSVEGLRSKSMRVNGRFVDEYYMGKTF